MGAAVGVNLFADGWICRWRVDDDQWQAEAYVVDMEGRLVVQAFALYPPQGSEWVLPPGDGLNFAASAPTPEGGITSATLTRSVQLGRAMAGLRSGRRLLAREDRFALFPRSEVLRGVRLEDEEWAKLAAWYLRALEQHPVRPYKVMLREAEARGRPETFEHLRDRIHLARKHGWLTDPPKQGRAGGEAGPKLIAWRREHPAEPEEEG